MFKVLKDINDLKDLKIHYQIVRLPVAGRVVGRVVL